MKKTICAVLILLTSTSSAMAFDAAGSTFGNLTTAQAAGGGQARFAGGVGVADATSFFGAFTYGMSQYVDGRFKLGLISDNDETELALGADLKYQLWSMGDLARHPFDLAVGGLFEFVGSDGSSMLQVGMFSLGSYPMRLSNGRTLSPYGRINLRLERWDSDHWGTDSELKFGFHGGVCYEASEFISLYGEFQIDGNDGIFLGLDYRIL
ncbi:MAG: hypothetical protein KOO62_10865 [candidate division Zixibacteria bacterium]|nr:hypothetical protein [candidate division Zixibacteria bacterium]